MKHENLFLALDEIESKEHLIDLFKHDEYNSWIHVKYGIFRNVINLNQINKKKEIKAIFLLSILKNFFFKFKRNKSKQLFFGSTRGLLQSLNGIIDIYLIKDVVKKSETKMFMTLNSFEDIQKFNSYINENEIVFDNLHYNLHSKLFKNKIKSKNDYSEIIQLFKKNKISITSNTIKKLHDDYISKYNYYLRLIKKFKNAQNAIIVSSHSKTFITAALKKQKIKVIEVQHGIIGRSHIGYNLKCDTKKLPIPDILYVYNDFWKNEILLCNFTKNIKLFPYYKYENINPLINKINKPYILFTGQGYFYKEIKKFIQSGISFLKENHLSFIYKPHPSEDNKSSEIKALSEIYNPIVQYDEPLFSTEYLIKYSSAHISIKSSCHFDAVSIIGKTYILEIDGYKNNLLDYKKQFPDNFDSITKLSDLKI